MSIDKAHLDKMDHLKGLFAKYKRNTENLHLTGKVELYQKAIIYESWINNAFGNFRERRVTQSLEQIRRLLEEYALISEGLDPKFWLFDKEFEEIFE